MSSQDLAQYAQEAATKAESIQSEITKEEANLASLDDEDSKTEKRALIASHQQKLQEATGNAQRLNQEAAEQQQQELQEQLKKQEEGKDGLLKSGAKELVERSFVDQYC